MFGTKQKPIQDLVIRLVLFLALVLPAGCGSAARQPAPARPSVQPTMALSPGDIIEIKFSYAEQFNEVQTIRPDGKISLPLVGEVVAAGKTPSDLQEQLTRLHAGQLQHPELAVIVRSLYDRKVYVGGAVVTPGMIEMPGNLTALEAIMQAGGFDLTAANLDNVILIRFNADNQPTGHRLEFENVIEGEEYNPVYLQPRDVIYVSRTTIVEVNQWVQQHIYELLPFRGIGLGYSIN